MEPRSESQVFTIMLQNPNEDEIHRVLSAQKEHEGTHVIFDSHLKYDGITVTPSTGGEAIPNTLTKTKGGRKSLEVFETILIKQSEKVTAYNGLLTLTVTTEE